MNTKYIEADKVLETICAHCPTKEDGVFSCWCKQFEAVNNIPPANVKPVVRGKWLDGRCTNCAWELPDYEYYGGYEIGNISCDKFNFCPHCGADMRRQNE